MRRVRRRRAGGDAAAERQAQPDCPVPATLSEGPLDIADLSGADLAETVARSLVRVCTAASGGKNGFVGVVFDAFVRLGSASVEEVAKALGLEGVTAARLVRAAVTQLATMRLLWKRHEEEADMTEAEKRLTFLIDRKQKFAVDYRWAFAVMQCRLRHVRKALSRTSKTADEEEWVCQGCGWVGRGEYAAFEMRFDGGARSCGKCGCAVSRRVAEDVALLSRRLEAVSSDLVFQSLTQLISKQSELLLPGSIVSSEQSAAAVIDSGDFVSKAQYERHMAARAITRLDSAAGQASALRRLAMLSDDAVEVELVSTTAAAQHRTAVEQTKRKRAAQHAPAWMKRRRGLLLPSGSADNGAEREPVDPPLGAMILSGRDAATRLSVDTEYYAAALKARGVAAAAAGSQDDDEWITPERYNVVAAAARAPR